MKRRQFVSGIGALGLLSGKAAQAQGARTQPARTIREQNQLKISDVQVWRLRGKAEVESGRTGQRQVQPLHIYPEHRPAPFRPQPKTERRTIGKSALYIKILTNEGLTGIYGPIDSEAALVVDRQLKRFLIGKNPLAGETLWDKMYRLNRHSRAGHFMMGISAIDNALWDLRGRYYNAPVYRLLGGPTRKAVEVYGSCLGYSVDPELAAEQSAVFKKQGFRYQKWFLAYGPGDGTEGLKKNVALVKALRESVGYEVELMFDAFMGWDFNYAMSWCKQVEKYRPRWIEEAFPPNRLDSFAQLSREISFPVATGEHFYGRWEVNEFLKAQAISVVQADPEWCGGVSELVKICTLASVHDVHVVPHGHSLHAALHVVAGQSPITCPLVEYLINKMKTYHHFEKHPLQVTNGQIDLPQRPGFGIEWEDAKIEDRQRVEWS